MADPTTTPFGLDPATFATIVTAATTTGVLLLTRIIDAVFPRGKAFKFTRSWFVNGEKMREEVSEADTAQHARELSDNHRHGEEGGQ